MDSKVNEGGVMQWSEVEPVLNATYGLLDSKEEVTQEEVCAALGRPQGDATTVRALELLYNDDYIGGFMVQQSPAPVRIRATPKGLQRARGWPAEGQGQSEQVELLLRLLDERIDSAETADEEKSKLRQARDAFAGLGKDIAVGVLTAYATQATGANQ
jgi:hypothetical protein